MLKNLEHEAFCRAFIRANTETYNVAYRAYSEAYGIEIPRRKNNPDQYDHEAGEYAVCQVSGSRVLNREDVQARIKEIWLEQFEDDKFSDMRVQQIISGGKDADSINAIKVRNDLKQRIVKKLDITTGGRPLAGMSDEELEKLASE